MNFITKTPNELIINFKNKENLLLNSKNLLKEDWPIYELWIKNEFIGFWEFIPNHLIGVNQTEEYKYWGFIYNYLFIFDHNHHPSVFFKKDGDDFFGAKVDDFDYTFLLKYIET